MIGLRRMMMSSNATGGGGPSWGNVVSLLHFDGENGSTTFTDQKGVIWGKHSDASLTTSVKKFGTAAAKFNGPLQSNITSSEAIAGFDLIGSDFTVEMWCRVDAIDAANDSRLFSTGGGALNWSSSTGIHVLLQISTTGKLDLQISQNNGSPVRFLGSLDIPLGQFVFLTACWNNSEKRAYLGVNGVVEASPVITGIARPPTAPRAAIGKSVALEGSQSDFGCLNGWVDEFRLTKGEAFRTANFTPPTGPFPNGP